MALDTTTDLIYDNLQQLQFTQLLNIFTVTYPLAELFQIKDAPTGTYTVFYRAYDDTIGDQNGTEDMTIADLNAKDPTAQQMLYKATISRSRKMKLYSQILNQFTFNVALFNTILNDVEFNQFRPLYRDWYIKAMTTISTKLASIVAAPTANNGGIIELENTGATSAASDAKLIYEKVQEITTPNPLFNISATDQTSSDTDMTIEKVAKREDLILVVDKKYSSQYNFDLKANTFKLEGLDIEIPTKNIKKVDITAIKNYLTTNDFDNILGFICEKTTFNMILNYKAQTATNTTKLWTITTSYWKYINAIFADTYLIPIIKKTTT